MVYSYPEAHILNQTRFRKEVYMRRFVLLLVFMLSACGTTTYGGATPVPPTVAVTVVPTTTPLPAATRVPRPTITVAPTAQPNVTAVPLLDSITVMYIEKGWSTISPMLADQSLQEMGEASADKPFAQDIPFKVEGITLVARTQFSADKLSDGGMICVLYSRSDRTQWIIPVAVEKERPDSPGTYQIFTNAQDPRNVLARSALPSGLRIVVYR